MMLAYFHSTQKICYYWFLGVQKKKNTQLKLSKVLESIVILVWFLFGLSQL